MLVPVVKQFALAPAVDGALARGANRELNSVPEDAVASLWTIVLFTRFTMSESSNDTPAPSQPATLLAMMLFVTLTEFHWQFDTLLQLVLLRASGILVTSVPLTCCRRSPPPLPESAALPRIRFASTTMLRPTPSLGVID